MMEQRYRVQPSQKDRKKMCEWERLQLGRLICVLVLFLAVFLGKRVCPERMLAAGEQVVNVLGHNMDIEAVFSRLGESIHGEEGALEGLQNFCIEVFGGEIDISQPVAAEETILDPVFPVSQSGLLASVLEETINFGVKEMTLSEQIEHVPAVGSVLIQALPQEEMPEGYTADKLSFGSLETVTPVVGQLNSGFGYREHPISGKYCFHSGADIAAGEGEAILAFADGVVEYIGEDSSYGRYLQLDHGEGIKSFYAHCQKLCVEKGQQVVAGETIATVGATGTATGPHLHLELKCLGKRVDPAYYVELL